MIWRHTHVWFIKPCKLHLSGLTNLGVVVLTLWVHSSLPTKDFYYLIKIETIIIIRFSKYIIFTFINTLNRVPYFTVMIKGDYIPPRSQFIPFCFLLPRNLYLKILWKGQNHCAIMCMTLIKSTLSIYVIHTPSQ